MFILAGFAAGLFSFKLYGKIQLSMDAAIFVCAMFVLGVIGASWVMAITYSINNIKRTIVREFFQKKESWPLGYIFTRFIFSGGGLALTAILTGSLFRLDYLNKPDMLTYLLIVPLVFLTTMVIHYSMMILILWGEGMRVEDIVRNLVIKGITFESLFIPLSVLLVMVYTKGDVVSFLLLVVVCLIFSYIFRDLNRVGEKLAQRVKYLTVINSVVQAISSTLELSELLPKIAKELIRLIGEDCVCTIALKQDRGDTVNYFDYNKDGDLIGIASGEVGTGLIGWIILNNSTLVLNDLQSEFRRYLEKDEYIEPEYNSWLGLALSVYDEARGAIVIQSKKKHRFDKDTISVIEAVAGQCAIAIENARLYEKATVDGLTSLFARSFFEQRIVEELKRCKRYKKTFSFIIFDLDDFKKINDTYGHQAGDKVLRETSGLIKGLLREIDIPARYGGEEIAVILPECRIDDAMAVAERIRSAIDRHTIILEDGTNLHVTISGGVSNYPLCGEKAMVSDIVEKADMALYKAKSMGKNRVLSAHSKVEIESGAYS